MIAISSLGSTVFNAVSLLSLFQPRFAQGFNNAFSVIVILINADGFSKIVSRPRGEQAERDVLSPGPDNPIGDDPPCTVPAHGDDGIVALRQRSIRQGHLITGSRRGCVIKSVDVPAKKRVVVVNERSRVAVTRCRIENDKEGTVA